MKSFDARSKKNRVGQRTQKQDGTQHLFLTKMHVFSRITVWGSEFLLAIHILLPSPPPPPAVLPHPPSHHIHLYQLLSITLISINLSP